MSGACVWCGSPGLDTETPRARRGEALSTSSQTPPKCSMVLVWIHVLSEGGRVVAHTPSPAPHVSTQP